MNKIGSIMLILAICRLSESSAAVFAVDGANSSASFEVGYFASGVVKGVLSRISGRVDLDVNTRVGSGEIVFDMTAVETGSAITNRFVKSGSIFNTEKFPTMMFRATRFDFEGDRLMAVNGDLQLHGVTRAIRLEARQFACVEVQLPALVWQDAARQPCHGEFTTVIYRSHFGMNRFRMLVDDEVLIHVSLELTRISP